MNTRKIFSGKSIRFQLVIILITILIIPVSAILYDIFFLSKTSDMLLTAKEERLKVIVSTLVRDMNASISKQPITFENNITKNQEELLQNTFNHAGKPLTESNPGVRVGIYIPQSENIYVQGFLHGYRNMSPKEEEQREERVYEEAYSGLVAVAASGRPLTRVIGSLGDETFEHLEPVYINKKLVAVAWADERVHPVISYSEGIRFFSKIFTLIIIFIGAIGAMIIIHNYATRVRIIKEGLAELEKDLNKLLPDLPGESGEIAQAINEMAISLSHKEKLEEELHRSERLASLGHLVTGVAHELRNPIGIIKATVQLMEGEYKNDPEFKEFVTVIKEQINRQNTVIKELLDFGRPQKPVIQELSINVLLEGILTFTEPLLRQHKITLHRYLEPELPITKVDGERLKQVFVNIILNAVQAMQNGGNLTISTSASAESVNITFTDNGPGISSTDIPHIFDPFYTTKHSGTGLGLSISHQIVEQHGGTIDVTSTPGEGSTFKVILPRNGFSPENFQDTHN
ncbi:ATP-binding protein [Desulfolucanica intricata]|uniref:ATP-binding protein n=1 Tax=Desulfolucanica intricata TaxID=1285191 RepID=UPI00082F5631|nr:ATP-binding protein [Desulfolucanica intricata]